MANGCISLPIRRSPSYLEAAFSRWPAGTGHFRAHRRGRHCHGARRPLLRYCGCGPEHLALGSRRQGRAADFSGGLRPQFEIHAGRKKLCYMIVMKLHGKFRYKNPGELLVADLESGRSEPFVPGLPVLEFDLSVDGRQVVMSTPDAKENRGSGSCRLIGVRRPCRFRTWRARLPNLARGTISSLVTSMGSPCLFIACTRTAPNFGKHSATGLSYGLCFAGWPLDYCLGSASWQWTTLSTGLSIGRRPSNPNRPISLPELVAGRPIYVDGPLYHSIAAGRGPAADSRGRISVRRRNWPSPWSAPDRC